MLSKSEIKNKACEKILSAWVKNQNFIIDNLNGKLIFCNFSVSGGGIYNFLLYFWPETCHLVENLPLMCYPNLFDCYNLPNS